MSAEIITLSRRTVLSTTAAAAALGVPSIVLAGLDGDAAIIAAEAEIARIYDWVGRQPCKTAEQEAALDLVRFRAYRLEDFVAAAVPIAAAGAAAKLRSLLDCEVGMPAMSSKPSDFKSMLLILDYLQSVAGEPTHPTRPLWQDDGEAP